MTSATVGGDTVTGDLPPPAAFPALTGPGPSAPLPVPGPRGRVVDGVDWGMPGWVRPAANSGFFSEEEEPATRVAVRSIDLTWRQLAPRPGVLDTSASDSTYGMTFDGLDRQLARPGPFWVRIFASGTDWAPEWVRNQCGVGDLGPDDDGRRHLPIWNDCVWRHLMQTYRQLFVERGLRSDPRLRLVYVPGAFTWAEYDYEMVDAAFAAGSLTYQTYRAWYDHAWTDLARMFGAYRNRLVFTGEDYPYSDYLGAAVGSIARDATRPGLGIRTGLSEVFNNHLSEAPSYGSRVLPNGHLSVDETLPIHDGRHVVAVENECYTSCGYQTTDPGYAVVQSNLKALQLRANWIYVVPRDSYLRPLAAHWDWVRLSMGATVATSADAWANLRDAQDTYWQDNDAAPFTSSAAWPRKPWVRNLERWLVQRDAKGAVARPAGVDKRVNVVDPANGVSYEGLTTSLRTGDTRLLLDLDDRFVARTRGATTVLVTFWDASGPFRVDTSKTRGPVVTPAGSARWRTVSVTIPTSAFDGRLPARTDLAVQATGRRDVAVRFVRVVRQAPPR